MATRRRISKRAAARRPQREGFDFTSHMRALCEDITRRCPELAHVEMDRVAVTFSQARKRVMHGLHATLTPMRFAGGKREEVRGGRRYGVQSVVAADGREMLYILSFYLPRFLDVDFREKLVTVFHELWHISPRFDGDLRRHPGRCYVHSGSQARYDEEMGRQADRWLAADPPQDLYSFLHCRFDDLVRVFGGVYGVRIPQPKLLPLSSAASRRSDGAV